MSAFSREELIEACAALHQAAQENFMLPPLIRGATEFASDASFTYRCRTENYCLKFTVDFDALYVERQKFPLDRIPVAFRSQLCDRDWNDLPIKIDDRETSILIYAFLLGVNTPIVLEEDDEPPFYRIALQLSPTFFLRWRLEFDGAADATAEEICRRVASSLYEKSKDFFMSEADGLAIWSARAAEELFGAEQPSAEALWSHVSAAERLPPPNGGKTEDAEAADCVSAPATPLAAVAAPIAAGGPARPWRASQIAALAAAALIALFAWRSSAGVSNADAPAAALQESPPQSAAVVTDEGEAPRQVAEPPAPPEQPAASAPQPEQSAALAPELSLPSLSEEAAPQPPAPSSPAAELAAVPERCTPIVNPAAPRRPKDARASTKSVAHAAKAEKPEKPQKHAAARRRANPLIAVGRAITRFATGVAKSIQSLPHRLSIL